jgi:uncharacterized membrane protein HdeD (DUF308 family)
VLLQMLFSFYVIATGFILLTGALYAFDTNLRHRYVLLADSVINVAIGLVFFVTLHISMQGILTLFALHAAAIGVFYLLISLRMRKQLVSRILVDVAGAISLGAGVRFFLRRGEAMHVMTSEIAVYSALLGVVLLVFSITQRTHRQDQRRLAAAKV